MNDFKSLYNLDDLWARRNPNTVLKEAGEPLTKTLIRRILRWAEMAKSEKTGQLTYTPTSSKQIYTRL